MGKTSERCDLLLEIHELRRRVEDLERQLGELLAAEVRFAPTGKRCAG